MYLAFAKLLRNFAHGQNKKQHEKYKRKIRRILTARKG